MLFNKLGYFTDIHFGRSLNSPVALKDNLDFIEWFIAEAKTRQCDTFIFGGDWFDNRFTINVNTLDHALTGIEMIADSFPKSLFLKGNHDLFLRERRDVSSMSFAKHIDRVKIISDPVVIDDVLFLPWLVGDEHKMTYPSCPYTFAHLELPNFMMNAKSIMPEGDHLMNIDTLGHGTVFTGHFHKRQRKRNIIYTGNVMPFDFSDNWDEDRGAMFLEWGGEPEFVAWPDQPLFRTMTLSDVIADPNRYMTKNLTARISIDVDLNYEEVQVVREHLTSTYGVRKLELIPAVKQEESAAGKEIVFQTIDQIVIDGLSTIQSTGMKADRLVSLYKSLA